MDADLTKRMLEIEREAAEVKRELAAVWRAVEGDERINQKGIMARLDSIEAKQDALIEAESQRQAVRRFAFGAMGFFSGGSLLGIVTLIILVLRGVGA